MVLSGKKARVLHAGDIEKKRLAQHNSGTTSSIRQKIPFVLVYSESFLTRQEAVDREKYYKSAAGRRFLKNKIVR